MDKSFTYIFISHFYGQLMHDNIWTKMLNAHHSAPVFILIFTQCPITLHSGYFCRFHLGWNTFFGFFLQPVISYFTTNEKTQLPNASIYYDWKLPLTWSYLSSDCLIFINIYSWKYPFQIWVKLSEFISLIFTLWDLFKHFLHPI